jgi:hypothetical protein
MTLLFLSGNFVPKLCLGEMSVFSIASLFALFLKTPSSFRSKSKTVVVFKVDSVHRFLFQTVICSSIQFSRSIFNQFIQLILMDMIGAGRFWIAPKTAAGLEPITLIVPKILIAVTQDLSMRNPLFVPSSIHDGRQVPPDAASPEGGVAPQDARLAAGVAVAH